MQWYKISCKTCHVGAGKNYDQILYIYNQNLMSAVKVFRRQGAVPHNKFPEIRALNLEESSRLETYVRNNLRMPIDKARRTCLRCTRENPPM